MAQDRPRAGSGTGQPVVEGYPYELRLPEAPYRFEWQGEAAVDARKCATDLYAEERYTHADGTLTVIHEDSPDAFRVVQNLATKAGARTMALDPKTRAIFLPTARFGPPPPASPENPRPRRPILAGSFEILVAAPAR